MMMDIKQINFNLDFEGQSQVQQWNKKLVSVVMLRPPSCDNYVVILGRQKVSLLLHCCFTSSRNTALWWFYFIIATLTASKHRFQIHVME